MGITPENTDQCRVTRADADALDTKNFGGTGVVHDAARLERCDDPARPEVGEVVMADAFPMIQQGMKLQKQGTTLVEPYEWAYFGFYACPMCHHEMSRRDTMYIFDCDWCEKEAVSPVWVTPKEKDGEIVLDVSEETYNPMLFPICDVG